MLTKEDLQAIRGLMKEEISVSEERLKIEMRTEIQASEERTKREMKAYIENTAEKQIKTIAEGHSDLRRDMKDLLQQDRKISDLQDRMFAVELKLKQG